jgi:hypothetical protein
MINVRFSGLRRIVALAACLLAVACGGSGDGEGPLASGATPSPPEFRLVAENVSDIPIKTQVEQHIVVSGVITEEKLRELLRKQHAEISARSGFKYHKSPTNIYVYLYGTEEKAKAGQGLWLAMSQMSFGETEQQITVRSEQIAQLGEKPQEKFGLSEKERQEVYKEMAQLDKRATDEAIERYPSDIHKQLELERRLQEKYERALAKRRRLTPDQLQSTLVEGAAKQWVFSG